MKNIENFKITIISLLLLAGFLTAFQKDLFSQVIQNDVFWHDTDGNPIYTQGGGVLKVDSTWYWYGVRYSGADDYYDNPGAGKNSGSQFNTMTCYSSTDLANWKFEGDLLTTADGLGGWIGRVGCAYNEPTGKYVLIAQNYPGLMFATSDTPTGPFKVVASQRVIGNVVNDMTGDQSVFTDDDGQAYLAYCNVEGRSHQYISRLRPSDYLYVEPAVEIHSGSGREGNVLFKHNGTYYFISSDLHGWNTSQTYCITATNIWGPYSSEFVIQGTENDYSHVTQSGLAFAVQGTSGSFVVFGGDRWADFAGNGVGYNQWCPITFDGDKPIFHSLSQWNINAAEGIWSVGSGNNYVLNPNIEADRISVSKITGWNNSGSATSNINGSHEPGRWALSHSGTAPYVDDVYQIISLPNDTFRLTAWVKSSGGQNTSKIYVKNYGGSEMEYSINSSINNWTQVSIPDIIVTNGSIQVGVYSDANGGNWVNVDDFSLVLASEPFCEPTTIVPNIQINGGEWINTTSVEVSEGDDIKISPEAPSNSSWIWNGPSGFYENTREITIGTIQNYEGGNYVVTYTNECGAKSYTTFHIVVGSQSATSCTIQENELGFCGLDGTIDNNNPGFSGDGFANTPNESGTGVNYKVTFSEDGTYPFIFRYANGGGGNRPGKLMINGNTVIQTIDFPATGSWTNWSTATASVSINAGTFGIRLEATGSDGLGNIDYLEIKGTSVKGDSCTAINTGIRTQKETSMDFTCYPVPVCDQLNIVFNKQLTGSVDLQLINSTGATLYSIQLYNRISHSINTERLPNGLYLVRIYGTNIEMSKQIIK
ncbi:MAG TPA: family 43 glycosylhydrolase [Prolixibacteraceae bacterium]|nr:family 43 glycosylhydrolase [Prolixibacteraceae bacterium]